MRERRNCVQVASSNLSLLEPTLCTSISYSSAMTLRRESVFCGNRVPLAPFQVLLVSYGMTASVMSYSIVLHDLQAVNTYPPLRGAIESHRYCGSILLQRQGSNYADHYRANIDNENGNGHQLCYTATSALPNFLRACVTVKVVSGC